MREYLRIERTEEQQKSHTSAGKNAAQMKIYKNLWIYRIPLP